MIERLRGERPAGAIDARIADDGAGIGAVDAGLHQQLARQVEAADRGILVEVAQDVGELQRAAEMVRQLSARRLVHAEDAGRQPADGAGDAVAIEVERREIGRADVGRDIHLHAVDHGEEIVLSQAEGAAPALAGSSPGRPAGRRRAHRGRWRHRPSAAARAGRGRVPSSAMSSTSRQNM